MFMLFFFHLLLLFLMLEDQELQCVAQPSVEWKQNMATFSEIMTSI